MLAGDVVRIEGVKETLKIIGRFDKNLRKQFTKDFKDAVQPLVEAAQANIPNQPPLSGMARNWKGRPFWDEGKEERRIKVKVDTRRARSRDIGRGVQFESVGAVTVIASGRALAVFDMAGRKNRNGNTDRGAVLIDRLNSKFRSPSRAMWPAADETRTVVTRNCERICRKAEAEATRLLATNTTWMR